MSCTNAERSAWLPRCSTPLVSNFAAPASRLATAARGLCQLSSLLGATFSGCGAPHSSGFQNTVRRM
jgi:hypothetical protein